MPFLTAIIAILVFLAASYGWGFAALRWVARNEVNYPSFLSVAGVAIWVFLGGILNLAGIAYPVMMYGLLILGLIFFAMSFPARFNTLPTPIGFPFSDDGAKKTSLPDKLLPLLIVAVMIVFFAATLLPSDVFNHGDDFQTYIPRPIRMLQIGTLAGNPYELLGLDSFGAQAFLQSFILLKFPVAYLPGFDSVFCLGLAGLLLVAIARMFKLDWVYATFAILVLFVINPQSVNVSALYSGVAVILGLLFASSLLAEKLSESDIAKPLGMAALVGLFIAALVALKTTLIFFVAIYGVFFCLSLFATTPNKRRALLISAAAGMVAVIAILPWLLLYLHNYVAALKASFHSATETSSGRFSLPSGKVSELFSTHDLFYGGSMLGYGVIILLLATLGILSIVFVSRNRSTARSSGYALASASACAAAIATYFLNGVMFAPEVAIRYSCPVLIATLPFAWLAISATALTAPQPGLFAPMPVKTTVLAGTALVFALFSSNFYDRVVRAYNQRTMVAFPVNDGYIQFNRYAISEKAQQIIRNIQYQTEAGTKILAWISMPLHLDFARNDIQTMMEPGLNNPWVDVPLQGSTDDMAQYLRSQGIRYVFWEYHGGGMKDEDEYYVAMRTSPYPIYRRMAERNLRMRGMLFRIMAGKSLLYHQNGIVLFDLNQIN